MERLDNYEQVGADAPLHGMARELAAGLAPGLSLVVLSRTEPPPPLPGCVCTNTWQCSTLRN